MHLVGPRFWSEKPGFLVGGARCRDCGTEWIKQDVTAEQLPETSEQLRQLFAKHDCKPRAKR